MDYDDEDDREPMDIEPETPLDRVPVKFNVPMPSVEQVTGEIARQILAAQDYNSKKAIDNAVHIAVTELIAKKVDAAAGAMIDAVMSKPIQPTDNFGNPVGDPVTLEGIMAKKVSEWATQLTDSEGKVFTGSPDYYSKNKYHPRINWMLGQCVNGEMKKLVTEEVKKITATLKASATQNIAKQIADQVAALVMK